MVQKTGMHAEIPTAASAKDATPSAMLCGNRAASDNPKAPAKLERAKCQRRSPNRSELLPIAIMATIAAAAGMVE